MAYAHLVRGRDRVGSVRLRDRDVRVRWHMPTACRCSRARTTSAARDTACASGITPRSCSRCLQSEQRHSMTRYNLGRVKVRVRARVRGRGRGGMWVWARAWVRVRVRFWAWVRVREV